MKIEEGKIPFHGYETWYRIAGEGDRPPLVLLHGGPGSTHNYFELLDRLACDGRRIISYDQLGCGNSYVDGHPELWKKETWQEELKNLVSYLHLEKYHLLGQSWGGMLAISCLIDDRPEGVQSVILSSTLPASWMWKKELHRLISFMSEEEQRAIAEAEKTGDFTGEAYRKANAHFMELHCQGKISQTDPECIRRPKKTGEESYLTAWGPNEYEPTGTLRDFDYTDRLKEISVPALVISGTNDLCTPLIAKTMYDRIPQSSWELFDGCRHMCFAEQTDHYCSLVSEWMKRAEAGNRKESTDG